METVKLQDVKFEKNYNNNTITISFNNESVITNKEYHNKTLSVFTNKNTFVIQNGDKIKLQKLNYYEMIFSHFIFNSRAKRLTDLFTLRIHPDETFFKTEETDIDPFVKLFNNEIKNKDVNVISFENGKKIISANGTPIVETNSNELKRINFEKAKDIPESFLFYDEDLEEANLPNVSRVLDNTFFNNKNMKVLNIPKAQYIGNNILYNNKVMEEIYLPSATYIGSDFLLQNENKKIHISDKLKNFNNILFKIQSKER